MFVIHEIMSQSQTKLKIKLTLQYYRHIAFTNQENDITCLFVLNWACKSVIYVD